MRECSCDKTASAIDLASLDGILERHAGDADGLMPVLQEAQEAFGYLPAAVIETVARARKLPLAAVYGVATFYARLRLEPRGRSVVRVCHGTACYVSGAQAVTDGLSEELGVAEGGTTADGAFTLETVACLGCCGLAPVMVVDDRTHGKLSRESAVEAIRTARRQHA